MVRPATVLTPRPAGLYCPPADLYIDPIHPVDRAVITHGHADHARPGHGRVLATAQTLAIMEARYGAGFAGSVQALDYGESLMVDGVELILKPAGHILGSAQAVIRHRGLTLVVSGDYKRRRDSTCAPFEPERCHVFVTEATFGLPVFRHPPAEQEIARLLAVREEAPQRPILIGAYALGKAQRLIALLREAGFDAPIPVHGALESLNALYGRFGVDLGPLESATTIPPSALEGAIVLAPPGALATPWRRRFRDPLTGIASGWMRVRARARRQGVELPLVISDHADWDELTLTLSELRPEEVWITHGREEALMRWCELKGLSARALAIVGYDEESE